MKKFTKGLAVGLSAIIIATAGVACGGGGSDAPSSSETTYINVQNYLCGYGRTYLTETMEAFMDAVKDVEYEPGKKGVYFDIVDENLGVTGQDLLNDIKNNPSDIFTTAGCDTYMLNEYKSDLMDLSEIFNTTKANSTSTFAPETSIMSRMDSEVKDYYTNADGSIYTVPLFYNAMAPIYDAGLVESKSLYIQEGSTDQIILLGAKATASKGVDGVKGTDDDGMPETYAQFFLWLNELSNRSITPITFAGGVPVNYTFAIGQFWADFEGLNGTKAAIDFNGQVLTDLIDTVDASGNVTYLPSTTITAQNGFMVMRQEGRYRALKLTEDLTKNSNKYFTLQSFNPNEAHTTAQTTFITSSLISGAKPVMMLMDGIYWETEADSTFTDYQGMGSGKMDRHFRLLPIPKYSRDMISTDQNNPTKSTYYATIGQQMVVKSGITGGKLDAIKDFLLFFNSSEQMAVQNNESAAPRPFSYSIDGIEDKMSTYQKSVYNVFHSDNVDIALWASKQPLPASNGEDFTAYEFLFASNTYGAKYASDLALRMQGGTTAKQWFDSLITKYGSMDGTPGTVWNGYLAKAGL